MRNLLLPLMLATGPLALLAATPTNFKVLTGEDSCSECSYLMLPGKITPSDDTRFTIHSDWPEAITSDGILYTTKPVLPPFNQKDGTPVPEHMRTQVNRGFSTISDDFEVFLFHSSSPGDGSTPRRLTVYAKNNGKETVTINPRQVILSDGKVGSLHEMESNLGKRVMAEDWDVPLQSIQLNPGQGEAIAWSKKFSALSNSDDTSANVNAFGIVRAEVSPSGTADLEVSVLGVSARHPSQTPMLSRLNLYKGANSEEGWVDHGSEPSDCQLRRTTGVFESFRWESDPVVIDLGKKYRDSLKFQMAAAQVQLAQCPEAQQTAKMILHPPSTRPDTVGNYMTDYYVSLHVINSSPEAKPLDVLFGKEKADVGLGWQLMVQEEGFSEVDALKKRPVETKWAGPKQADLQVSFLSELGNVTIPPGGERFVSLRFMILGNSSLPFQIEIK